LVGEGRGVNRQRVDFFLGQHEIRQRELVVDFVVGVGVEDGVDDAGGGL
jgi:hypothetical protein